MVASLNSTMYRPQSLPEQEGISQYWTSAERKQHGQDTIVTARIRMPFEEAPLAFAYVINRDIINYTKLLFVGDPDTSVFSDADFETYGSKELKEVIAAAEADGKREFELEGVLKCEALGYSLRYNTIVPVSDVTIDPNSPIGGIVTFGFVGADSGSKEQPAEEALASA